jgi:hypothetical protein
METKSAPFCLVHFPCDVKERRGVPPHRFSLWAFQIEDSSNNIDQAF